MAVRSTPLIPLRSLKANYSIYMSLNTLELPPFDRVLNTLQCDVHCGHPMRRQPVISEFKVAISKKCPMNPGFTLWFDHTTVTLVLCFLILNLYEAGNQFDQCLDFPAKNSHYHMCIKTTAARRTTERTLQGETKQVRVGYFLYIYDIFLKFWFIYPYISEKIQVYYVVFYGKKH